MISWFNILGRNSCFRTILVFLSIWSTGAMCFATSLKKTQSEDFFFSIIIWLFLTLVSVFISQSLLRFYFFFETSLIPILILILGWGYQPERVFAGIRILFYTIIASIPLLFVILVIWSKTFDLQNLFRNSRLIYSHSIHKWLFLGAILRFLVKLPMFLFHLWLPRAHVEAPVEGSIALAAVMLKLGGFGVFRIFSWAPRNPSFSLLIKAISLIGGGIIAITCLRQTDIKTLIAYSSVAHMSMALACRLCGKTVAIWAAAIAYLSHGLVSSGLFMGANTLYERYGSRNMSLAKASLSVIPLFSFFWFLLSIGNMGAPPTPNLLAEIFIISILFNKNFSFFFPLFIIAGLATAFTLNLYLRSQHHSGLARIKSCVPLSCWDCLGGGFHVIPLFSSGLLALILIYICIFLCCPHKSFYFSSYSFYFFNNFR